MPDISHNWGNDLTLSPTGDIATAADLSLSQQRVLRRLLTNLGEYIWNPLYGAGLPAYIGGPSSAQSIAAVIRAQMALEQTVAKSPTPAVTVTSQPSGVFTANIVYTDTSTGLTTTLTFPLG